jgi:hypothetical protein
VLDKLDKADLVEILIQHKGSVSQAARSLVVTERSLRRKIASLEIDLSGIRDAIKDSPNALPVITTVVREVDPQEMVKADRTIEKMEAQIKSLTARNKILARQANVIEEVSDILEPIVVANKMPPRPAYNPPKRPKKRTPITGLLPWNDWHWGENVDSASVEGLNAYSPAIAAARVQDLVDKTAAIIDDKGGRVNKIVLPILGDMFSGMHLIHPAVADEYAFVVKQGLDCALVTAQAIDEISQIPGIEEVQVEIPAGDNHTRVDRRAPTGKANQQSSLSTWYYDTVGNLLVDNKKVNVRMHRSYKATFKVSNITVAAAHGHMMKGGGGNLGIPAYAALRAFQSTQAKHNIKMLRFEDFNMTPVELFLMGHFHVDGLIPCVGGDLRFLPSLKGTDGFVNDVLEKHAYAMQRVMFVHPEHGVESEHRVMLNHIQDYEAPSRYDGTALDMEQPTGYVMRNWRNKNAKLGR